MYIKQVIIQGFKSYRDRTVVEPFHPGHNVIVGRNGSGKSNFFSAIEFVVGNDRLNLIPAQRRLIMHEGMGNSVTTAFIEIIFDNTDGRFPTNKTEVHLRRMIGSKKDTYFLDKAAITKTEVMNLLESAGFSRSNPYYIVKQGEINQFATATDSQRLKLLREIAGSRVYDETTEKSQANMTEIQNMLEKTSEYLLTIEERLEALEQEKEELKEYQLCDTNRRCLEYVIYNRELDDNERKLVQLQESNQTIVLEQLPLRRMARQTEEHIHVISERWKNAKKEVETALRDEAMLNTEFQHDIQMATKLSLMINDLQEEVKTNEDDKRNAQAELEDLQGQINEKMKQLEDINPEYDKLLREEEKITHDLMLKDQQRQGLYSKQGRKTQFDSKDKRDEWIQQQLDQLDKQIQDKEVHYEEIKENLANDFERRRVLENEIKVLETDMEAHNKSIEEYKKQRYEEMEKKVETESKLKELYRKENMLQENISSAKESLVEAKNNLKFAAGKQILNGQESVRKVLDTFRENAETSKGAEPSCVQVIDILSCDPEVSTAVEVTAGKKLYHHIVESDRVVTRILKEIKRQRLPGGVTFMPLNRLNVRKPNYPVNNDVIPLITKLVYDPKYDLAIRFIFGRTLICRSLEIATKFARSNGLNCVTLDGDMVFSKGSLTGGFSNKNRTQLRDHKILMDTEKQIYDLENQLITTKTEINRIIEIFNSHDSNIQRTEVLNGKSKDNYEKIEAAILSKKNEISVIDSRRIPMERSLAQCTTNLDTMRATRAGFERELNQDLTSQLSPAEHDILENLNDEIKRLTRESKLVFKRRLKYERKKTELENMLTNNLNRRKDGLAETIRQLSGLDNQRLLDSCRVRLEKVQNDRTVIQNKIEEQTNRVASALQTLKAELDELERWKHVQKQTYEQLEEIDRSLDKLTSKKDIYEQKKILTLEKIAGLGTLPNPEAYEKFAIMSSKNLYKEMDRTYRKLNRYSHVNQKAFDQLESFTHRKETLLKRKDELDRGYEKIQECMSTMEQKKFDAICLTFKQVSEGFTEVFGKLASPGHATLVMRTGDGESIDNDDSRVMDVDNFVGVGIKVSFTGRSSETSEMNQLSGGQKSIVALALIFAIQKCDPAPFYLFDEIDQALDVPHREAVAGMIHELSSDAQFITTTFKPEMLRQADKFYGVSFGNEVSHIRCVTQEQAAEFVEAGGNDER